MSPVFTINFRREAYAKEVARARQRVVLVGVWVAYFGVVAVAMGLYGLNCASLTNRLRMIERQTARLQATQATREQWQVPQNEMVRIERYALNPRRWHDRLERLGTLLPGNARVTSLAVNPQNLSGPLNEEKLVITGQMRPARGEDRMASVMGLVSALRSDSVFAASYSNVKLSSTRIIDTGTATTEFVIECQ